MAHVQKFTRGAVGGLSSHIERKTSNHSNKDIDRERTHLNYDLCEKDGDMLSRYNERLDEVYCFNRKDVKVVADWIVTLPEELKEKSLDEQREFFQETYDFLYARYGKENILAGVVHNDETTPHMHFSFMPVTYDKKKEREKVSAKEVLNRNELKSFHEDLDNYLRDYIPHIYQKGVLNDKTLGIEDVKTLKEQSERIDRMKDKLEKKADTVRKEFKLIKEMDIKARDVNDLNQKMTDFEYNLKRTVFGKRIMSSKDYNEFQKFVVGVQKSALKSVNKIRDLERENTKLKSEQRDILKHHKYISNQNEHLISRNKTLEQDLYTSNDHLERFRDNYIVSKSKLLDKGYDLSSMPKIESQGRVIVDHLEKGHEPKNKKAALHWQRILEKNKEEKLINSERLNKALEKLKLIIQKMISKVKDLGMSL